MRLLDGINDTEDELYTFDSIMETKTTSKGLEALEWLNDFGYLKSRNIDTDSKALEKIETIEKELKELEEHEEILNDYNLTLTNFREACLLLAQWKSAGLCWADYEKQKKALEIIKNKKVDVYSIFMNKTYEEYIKNESIFINKNRLLIQEEWNFLKEVLNNGR